MSRFIALAGVALLGAGCTVGPNYKKPTANIPGTYRGLAEEEAGKTEPGSLGDQKWWEVFQDEQLRSLIRTALQQNYDVRIAGGADSAGAGATWNHAGRSISERQCRGRNK